VSERTLPSVAEAPEWVAAQMPPGYQTRLFEIQRLSADLHGMDLIGRVLWETGDALTDAVASVFRAIECEVEEGAGGAASLAVKLGSSRRLLLVVSGSATPLQKTNEELARAFAAVQFASADDRVVLVVNSDPATPPADRPEPVLPDALDILDRMGVNVLGAAALFRLWRLWLEDRPKARKAIEALHAQDGGPFRL
jgi:hypothetical protein